MEESKLNINSALLSYLVPYDSDGYKGVAVTKLEYGQEQKIRQRVAVSDMSSRGQQAALTCTQMQKYANLKM